MTIGNDFERIALDLLSANGGSMRVQEVVTRAVMPSFRVRPVFTALIAAKRVRLEGDDLYVLAHLPAPAPVKVQPKPQKLQTPAAAPPPPKPPEPEPVKATDPNKTEKGKRRCVRCEELLTLDQFPMRPGMVRAPRICVGCLPPDEKVGSVGDRLRAGLPAERDQVPFRPPAADAPPPPPNMEPMKPLAPILPGLARAMGIEYVTIEVEVHTNVRRYIEQMVATGLYGSSVEEAAQHLLLEGVRRAMLSTDGKRP